MSPIHIHEEDYCLTLGGNTVQLLPKEFALFQFLYQHSNQTFSREVLLDKVWGLEEPVDRTVDDHIYRIRKKLKEWNQHLQIETVRGMGYRLRLMEPKPRNSPSLMDQGFNHQFNTLLSKYHLFGQGDALQTLTGQQQLLGVNLDPFYDMYTELLKGDWEVLFKDALSLTERMYFMVILYGIVTDDPHAGKELIEKVLSTNKLPIARQWELSGMDLGFFHLWCGNYEEAKQQAEWALEKVEEHQIEGFKLAVHIQQILPLWLTNHLEEAETKIQEVEILLKEKPYLRELSYFHLSKGICWIAKGELNAGKKLIQDGMDIVKQAQLGIQYLHALTHTTHLLKNLLASNDSFLIRYQTQRNEFIKNTKGEAVQQRLKDKINLFL